MTIDELTFIVHDFYSQVKQQKFKVLQPIVLPHGGTIPISRNNAIIGTISIKSNVMFWSPKRHYKIRFEYNLESLYSLYKLIKQTQAPRVKDELIKNLLTKLDKSWHVDHIKVQGKKANTIKFSITDTKQSIVRDYEATKIDRNTYHFQNRKLTIDEIVETITNDK